MTGTTLSDIAARVGCDKSTVSRALRNQTGVLKATSDHIRRVAEELGYRPDPVQVNAATRRWRQSRQGQCAYVMAFICPAYRGDLERRKRADNMFEAARLRLDQLGCKLDWLCVEQYPTAEGLVAVLKARGIRGLIIPSIPPEQRGIIEQIDWSQFAGVACQAGWVLPPLHVVENDEYRAVRWAWRDLVARGYRRIGPALAEHTPWAEDDFSRHGALAAEQQQASALLERLPVYRGDPTDRTAFLAWLEACQPDAVIGFHEGMADWIRQAGLRLPEDIGFLCLRGGQGGKDSGYRIDRDLIAQMAVDVLMSQVTHNQWGTPTSRHRILVAPTWVEGTTLRKLPVAATSP